MFCFSKEAYRRFSSTIEQHYTRCYRREKFLTGSEMRVSNKTVTVTSQIKSGAHTSFDFFLRNAILVLIGSYFPGSSFFMVKYHLRELGKSKTESKSLLLSSLRSFLWLKQVARVS